MAGRITYEKGQPYPLGVTRFDGGMRFSAILPKDSDVKLNIYRKNYNKPMLVIPFTSEYMFGNIGAVQVKFSFDGEFEYEYEINGEKIPDKYAVAVSNVDKFGSNADFYNKRAAFLEDFDWENDKKPLIPMEEVILYRLHVRGFTKHNSSGIKYKGTFAGIIEKIPYLKSLGINQLELMPVYEFVDAIADNKIVLGKKIAADNLLSDKENAYKCNFWGYSKENRYFAVKNEYSFEKNASNELKKLIKTLHQNDIEIILQFFFENEEMQFIIDCLRFWVMEYHIDGFRIIGHTNCIETIIREPLFTDVKIYCDYCDENNVQKEYLAVTNEQYKQTVRSFLKSDMGRSEEAAYLMRRNGSGVNYINYICCHDGFTMYDMVSFEQKHNELNGENNIDGTDYNLSWNCGIEGRTRKKKVISLRKQQMKNAWFMLMFSKGIPAILAGDELCNSQDGNNNAYCQDNAVGWVNWNTPLAVSDMQQFVCELIKIRKQYKKVFSCKEKEIMQDENAFPIVSYHGDKAWNIEFRPSGRHFGVMYTSEYISENENQEIVYLLYNMNWMPQQFALPKLQKNKNWYVLLDTSSENTLDNPKKVTSQKIIAKERSCILLVGK